MINTKRRLILTMPWLVLLGFMVLLIAAKLKLSFDLSAFLPANATLTQEVLLEQLRNGPGSRLLIIGLSGQDKEELSRLSDRLSYRLADRPEFINISNGEFDILDADVPSPVDRYLLLLGEMDFSQEALSAAMQDRLRELSMGGGANFVRLMARDPQLISLDLLSGLAPVGATDEMWFTDDGNAVLIAETRASAIDLQGQEQAIRVIRDAFEEVSQGATAKLDVTGVGAFGLELQETIRSEAKTRSLLASLALVLVIFLVYRRLDLVLLSAVPLSFGFVAGLAFITLLFEEVHGITLAFGFTLLGIAIDYPLHLFSHLKQKEAVDSARHIWPTIRLGAGSTAAAYLILSFSGSQGLAQLGVFTFIGVIVAALVTRYLLPVLASAASVQMEKPAANNKVSRRSFLPSIVAIAIAVTLLGVSREDGFWNDSLSSLSPVPKERLEDDRRLRSVVATPEMRYQMTFSGETLDEVLQQARAIDVFLDQAARDGLVGSWQSVSLLLPPRSVQLARRDAIPPDEELRERLSGAISQTPFRPDAFDPFLESARIARSLEPLRPRDFESTPLASWLDSHLLEIQGRWVGLVSFSGLDPEALNARIHGTNTDWRLVDLQESSAEMMRDYRASALRSFGLAALLISVLLFFGRNAISSIAWVGATLMAALSLTVALVVIGQGQMTVIHLIALLLVLGLGLDYALFLDRSESSEDAFASRRAVGACALSTTLAFGILAASHIPLLRFLGMTVAIGSAVSFVIAYLGSGQGRVRISRIVP